MTIKSFFKPLTFLLLFGLKMVRRSFEAEVRRIIIIEARPKPKQSCSGWLILGAFIFGTFF